MNKDELIKYCKEASQTISELDYENRILEKENQKLKQALDEIEKDTIANKESPCWGNYSYVTGKNEGVEETCNSILKIIQKVKGE